MARIIEKILEPSHIEVGSKFLLKIKIDDFYNVKRIILTEDGKSIITNSDEKLRTEWGN